MGLLAADAHYSYKKFYSSRVVFAKLAMTSLWRFLREGVHKLRVILKEIFNLSTRHTFQNTDPKNISNADPGAVLTRLWILRNLRKGPIS